MTSLDIPPPQRLKIDFPVRLRPELARQAEALARELGFERDFLINELLHDCFVLIEEEAKSGSSEFHQKLTSLATLKRFKERLNSQKLL